MTNPITGDVTNPVLLSNYPTGDGSDYALTISSTGSVDPAATALYGATGVEGGGFGTATLTNEGHVTGGNSSGPSGPTTPGAGGIGVALGAISGRLDNAGDITGGNGGNTETLGWNGGVGGIGVYMGGGSSFTTTFGTIAGGSGGNSGFGIGGAGGVGVSLGPGNSFSDDGGSGATPSIQGGTGGRGAISGGTGGNGLVLVGADVTTHGGVNGGTGGNGIYVSPTVGAADGGNGGAAVFLQGGSQFTIEASEIIGGTGGVGGNSPIVGGGLSGTGGTGVIVRGAGETLTNMVLPVPGGVIQGGQGGAGHAGGAGAGAGGMGVNIYDGGGSFDNQCIVTGGAGGYANDTTGSAAAANGGIGGVGVDVGLASSLVNSGSGYIRGGAGGNDNTPNGTAGTGGVGVVLDGGGIHASNSAGAKITGGAGGVGGGASSVGGTGGAGIELTNDGYLKNYGGAGIEGIDFRPTTITGGAGGVGAAGDGAGGVGAYLDGGKLYTAGHISGGESPGGQRAYSVFFGGGEFNTLIVAAGAAFTGSIGGFASSNFLEGGDTVDITTLDPSTVQSDFNTTTDTLVLPSADGGTLQFSGNFSGETFTFTADRGTGTDITLEPATPCYCRGTRILTVTGERAIETLGVGDRIVTASGGALPIRWIGTRRYAAPIAAGDPDLAPVRIRAGALGSQLPRRDLWVSPEHALYVEGVLIPARALVNGVSILQSEWFEALEYLHLEFETHAIIFAEGAPAESFADDDSRRQFDNAADYARLYPEAVSSSPRFCAPRLEEGELVEHVRLRLAERCACAPGVAVA